MKPFTQGMVSGILSTSVVCGLAGWAGSTIGDRHQCRPPSGTRPD